MGTDVIEIPKEKTLEVFTAKNGLDPYLEAIKKEVESFVPDVSSDKGRKAISSLAYKVSQSKTALDKVGKELVTELKKQPKLVDAERRRVREYLDNLRDEIRKPLTEYEEEKERILTEHAAKHAAAKLLEEFNSDHEFALLMDEKITAEHKEAARIAEEGRLKRDEEIRREAAETARVEAEQKAKIEQERLEQEKASAEAAAKESERQRKEAEERERVEKEARRIDYHERMVKHIVDCGNGFIGGSPQSFGILFHELEEKIVIDDSFDEFREQAEAAKVDALKKLVEMQKVSALRAEEDAELEARRVKEAEELAEQEANAKRSASKKHVGKIRGAAKDSIMAIGLSEADAKKLVLAIHNNEIANVSISY